MAIGAEPGCGELWEAAGESWKPNWMFFGADAPLGPLERVTEGLRECTSPLALEVPWATAGVAAGTEGTAGMMDGRPFSGVLEDDFACCGTEADDPVATTGVDTGFLTAPAAEA